jgi:hypothetical protein
MNDTAPYIQRPTDFHQCFEYVSHDTRCTHTAIVGEYFCVHHRIQPSPIILYPDGGFHIPNLTGRDSIVRVASDVAQRLAEKSIDDKRAGKILYACQIANQALEGKLRDQKLALQQAAASTEKPTTTPTITPHECHPDPATKDLSTVPATEPACHQPETGAILTLEAAASPLKRSPPTASQIAPLMQLASSDAANTTPQPAAIPRFSPWRPRVRCNQREALFSTTEMGSRPPAPHANIRTRYFQQSPKLEIEFQRQLANTRIAAKGCDLAERCCVVELQTSGLIELRRVERVEKFKAKLQLGILECCKLLEQRGIKVRV